MSDERMNELLGEVREHYHVPDEIPREAMWSAISERLGEEPSGDGDVIDLASRRTRRPGRRAALWGTAAAALLVLGIGIGRVSVPSMETPAAEVRGTLALDVAAREHLGRTESLLTMVRADARVGGLDPLTAEWARELLGETRLILDAVRDRDPAVGELLEDLELLLAQIVGVAGVGREDPRMVDELDLTLRGLEEAEVLSRIRAVLPDAVGAGA